MRAWSHFPRETPALLACQLRALFSGRAIPFLRRRASNKIRLFGKVKAQACCARKGEKDGKTLSRFAMLACASVPVAWYPDFICRGSASVCLLDDSFRHGSAPCRKGSSQRPQFFCLVALWDADLDCCDASRYSPQSKEPSRGRNLRHGRRRAKCIPCAAP